MRHGSLIQLSAQEAVLRTTENIELASNLKLLLLDPDKANDRIAGNLYAKVMESGPGTRDFVIRFTAHIPLAAEQILQAARRSAEREVA